MGDHEGLQTFEDSFRDSGEKQPLGRGSSHRFHLHSVWKIMGLFSHMFSTISLIHGFPRLADAYYTSLCSFCSVSLSFQVSIISINVLTSTFKVL